MLVELGVTKIINALYVCFFLKHAHSFQTLIFNVLGIGRDPPLSLPGCFSSYAQTKQDVYCMGFVRIVIDGYVSRVNLNVDASMQMKLLFLIK